MTRVPRKPRSTPRQGDRATARAVIETALRSAGVRRPRRGHPDRGKNLVLGGVFLALGGAALGGALFALTRAGARPGTWAAIATSTLLFGGIALLGLSMVIQGLRNRPGIDGFFYRTASALGRRITPMHLTLAPIVFCLVMVMQGVVLHDRAVVRSGFGTALIWLSIFAQLFLHELGHLLAVRRMRLPFVRLAAGPLALWPRGSAYRLGANREWRHFLMGAVYYSTAERPSARKILFVAAAGPVATAFVGLSALAAEDAYASDHASLAFSLASANAAIAGGTLVLNLLPLSLGRFESDGLQILRALRSLAGRG